MNGRFGALLFRRLKLRKLQKWENYLPFVENMRKDSFMPLSVGATDSQLQTTPDKLFAYLPLHKTLCKKYDLRRLAGEGGDFEKTVCLMQWLTDNTFYNGASSKWKSDNSAEILEYAFGKDFSHAINCREKAIVFADCLLAAGIYAYPVCMISEQNKGCHFTVQVYLREQNRWALFDPSFNCWFSENGRLLNVWELRDLFLAGKEPEIQNYSFNRTDRCKDIYKEGFIKQNLTNITTWQDNSMERRGYKANDWNSKKAFKTKLPDIERIESVITL